MEISRWREPPVLAPKQHQSPEGAPLIVAAIVAYRVFAGNANNTP